MRTKLIRNGVALGLVAALAIAGGYWTARQSGQQGPAVTPLRLPDLTGRQRQLGDWPGRFILINFWATWCAPCREEIPLLTAAQRRYGTYGLQIIGIAFDKKPAILAFQRQVPINYPVLLANDQSFELMRRYGNRVQGLPFSVLLSPRGEILATRLDAFRPAELAALLRAHIVKKP